MPTSSSPPPPSSPGVHEYAEDHTIPDAKEVPDISKKTVFEIDKNLADLPLKGLTAQYKPITRTRVNFQVEFLRRFVAECEEIGVKDVDIEWHKFHKWEPGKTHPQFHIKYKTATAPALQWAFHVMTNEDPPFCRPTRPSKSRRFIYRGVQ